MRARTVTVLRFTASWSLWSLLVLSGLACTPDQQERGAAPSRTTVQNERPQPLTRRIKSDVSTFNPLRATLDVDRQVGKYLFTPLVYLDRELNPVPGVAMRWSVSADGRRYRFDINPRATFVDGTRVRARDVVFTLGKIVDADAGALQLAGAFATLDRTQTREIDEDSVEVVFTQPLATQLSRFADVYVIPEHVYGRGDFTTQFNETAVGSGPYRLARYERNARIVLERRSDCWGTRPAIATVIFRVIADDAVAWYALQRGDIHETTLSSELWQRHRNDPAFTRTIDFRFYYTLNYNYIAWNTRHPILRDSAVRYALTMALPIEEINTRIYHGTARSITGPFTPDQAEYNTSVPLIPYDPAAAQRSLAARGWIDHDEDGDLDRNGQDLAFGLQIVAQMGMEPLAQLIHDALRKIGVRVTIETFDGSAATERLLAGNYDAAYMAWDLDAEPDLYALFHSSQVPRRGQNLVLYSDPEVDRLIERARLTMDADARRAIYRHLHERIARDQPYTWLGQVPTKWATSKRLRGVGFSGDGPFLWEPGEFAWSLAPESASATE